MFLKYTRDQKIYIDKFKGKINNKKSIKNKNPISIENQDEEFSETVNINFSKFIIIPQGLDEFDEVRFFFYYFIFLSTGKWTK